MNVEALPNGNQLRLRIDTTLPTKKTTRLGTQPNMLQLAQMVNLKRLNPSHPLKTILEKKPFVKKILPSSYQPTKITITFRKSVDKTTTTATIQKSLEKTNDSDIT